MIKRLEQLSILWGILLIVFGITAFIDAFVDINIWGWVIVLFFAGLIAGIANWHERTNLAKFIPSYVLWAVAGLIALVGFNVLINAVIPVYVLWVIALPFLIGYLRDQDQWGYLVPAYVLFVVGLMVGLIGLGWLNDLIIPAYVMFAIVIPFLVVYYRDRKNWWALIPAAIMGTIAFGFLLASSSARLILPLALVAIGAWILLRTVINK